MKKLSIILMTALVLSVAATSCKKKSAAPVQTTPTAPAPPVPFATAGNYAPNDIDGVLAAIKLDFAYKMPSVISNPLIPSFVSVESEIASAAFPSGSNSGRDWNTLVDAGTVKINDIALEKASNNAYYKAAMVGMPVSTLNFGSSGAATWSASGFNLTSYSYNGAFPSMEASDLPDEINRSSNLTISTPGSKYGVMLLIVSGSKSIVKSYGNVSSITVSSTDLSTLPTADNSAFIEVCPYNVIQNTISGKKYYFVKQTAAAKMISIK